MDEFMTGNPDDNEIYFSAPEEFQPIRSLFDRLEGELIAETLRGRAEAPND